MSKPDNIILIGFSATGKSAVGKKVALRLERRLVDTDEEIVRLAGKPIPEIFAEDGEPRFRDLERQALEAALAGEGAVVVTGGGAILDPDNRRLMQNRGRIFCLEARPETIHRRLANDALYGDNPVVRPLLHGDDPLARITALKAGRQPYYTVADWTVYTDDLDPDQVAAEVIRGWRYLTREADPRAPDYPPLETGPLASNVIPAKPVLHPDAGAGIQARDGTIVPRGDMNAVLLGQSPKGDKGGFHAAAKAAGFACQVSTPSGSYPVYVGWGLLDRLGENLRAAGLRGKAVIISDDAVFPLYGPTAVKSVTAAGLSVATCTVPAGEGSKTLKQAERLYDFLIAERVERGDFIVALGGGVVGDLAGFVAATFLRGLAWVAVPTSVIAMVDAAIGGKVAVDHPRGKNLIGAFHHPRFVLADTRTLGTLPPRELTSGWAEVVKHGFALDAELVSFLEKNVSRLRDLDRRATVEAVAWSARIKARVVSEDDRERGKRMLLNYGHTVGHGLEAAAGYGKLSHGEAVAVGMMAAAAISRRLGLIGEDAVERQRRLLLAFGLPVDARGSSSVVQVFRPAGEMGVGVAEVLEAIALDKKVRQKKVNWVLLEDIGRAVIRNDVPPEAVSFVLEELCVVP